MTPTTKQTAPNSQLPTGTGIEGVLLSSEPLPQKEDRSTLDSVLPKAKHLELLLNFITAYGTEGLDENTLEEFKKGVEGGNLSRFESDHYAVTVNPYKANMVSGSIKLHKTTNVGFKYRGDLVTFAQKVTRAFAPLDFDMLKQRKNFTDLVYADPKITTLELDYFLSPSKIKLTLVTSNEEINRNPLSRYEIRFTQSSPQYPSSQVRPLLTQ